VRATMVGGDEGPWHLSIHRASAGPLVGARGRTPLQERRALYQYIPIGPNGETPTKHLGDP